jgi:hypothetical protein
MKVETFNNAVTQAEQAFFQCERPAFLEAVEEAKSAVPEQPSIIGALTRAGEAFPAPRALELIMEAVQEAGDRYHVVVPQPLLSPSYCYTFYVAHAGSQH